MRNFNAFKNYQTRTIYDANAGVFTYAHVPNAEFLSRVASPVKTGEPHQTPEKGVTVESTAMSTLKRALIQPRQSVPLESHRRPRTAHQVP
jgi:hypothetical protein